MTIHVYSFLSLNVVCIFWFVRETFPVIFGWLGIIMYVTRYNLLRNTLFDIFRKYHELVFVIESLWGFLNSGVWHWITKFWAKPDQSNDITYDTYKKVKHEMMLHKDKQRYFKRLLKINAKEPSYAYTCRQNTITFSTIPNIYLRALFKNQNIFHIHSKYLLTFRVLFLWSMFS